MRAEIRRRESQIVLSDRGERYHRSWLPPKPDRVLILVHGFAEHTGRYDEMAMHFAERNFVVHAYDQAGHGRTKGARGHVDRFDRLVEELARFVELVARDHPGLPITLAGHSMGGLVVAATAAFSQPAVDRFILSGALLELGPEGRARRRLSLLGANVLSFVAPLTGFSTGLDPSGLSRDPEVARRYVEDPYVKDRMSARFAAGLSRLMSRTLPAADRVERPILVLHGEADPICSPSGSRNFFEGLSPSLAESSSLRVYPELRHEIFQEPEREEIWNEMLNWLER